VRKSGGVSQEIVTNVMKTGSPRRNQRKVKQGANSIIKERSPRKDMTIREPDVKVRKMKGKDEKKKRKDGFEEGPVMETKNSRGRSSPLKASQRSMDDGEEEEEEDDEDEEGVPVDSTTRSDSPGIDLSIFQPRGKRKCVLESEGKRSTKKRGWWSDEDEEIDEEDLVNELFDEPIKRSPDLHANSHQDAASCKCSMILFLSNSIA
jgi:hypothetical protein